MHPRGHGALRRRGKAAVTSHNWPRWGGADLIGFLDEVARPVPVDTWPDHATFISISCRSLPPLYLCINVCLFLFIFHEFNLFLKKDEFIHSAVLLVEKYCVVLIIVLYKLAMTNSIFTSHSDVTFKFIVNWNVH